MRGYRCLGAKIISVYQEGRDERSVVRKVYQNFPGTKRIVCIDKAYRPVAYNPNRGSWDVFIP